MYILFENGQIFYIFLSTDCEFNCKNCLLNMENMKNIEKVLIFYIYLIFQRKFFSIFSNIV